MFGSILTHMPSRPAKTPAANRRPIPDRGLELDAPPLAVTIRTSGRHPIIFRKMVDAPRGAIRPNDGDIVTARDREGLFVGHGIWNRHSEVALRLLSRETEPPGTAFWQSRLGRALALRRDVLGLDQVTNAYRVVHAEGDGITGLIVDRYDDVLSVETFSLGIHQRIGPILEVLAGQAGTRHFRVHVDERIAHSEGFPGHLVVSPEAPDRVTIHEHGIRYRVRFEGGHKTGFFCDQRDNRRELARYCGGRVLLDLCCYTGGFALNALIRGQAADVTAVDLDEKAIAVARDNANLNQVRVNLVHADAFSYARQMAVNGSSYGVVVLDPPKLIPSRAEVAIGKRKYFDLNVLAMGLVEPDGLLLTCSCSGLLGVEEFLSLLAAAARKAGRPAQVLAVTGAGADHPVSLDAPEGAYLKAVWLRLGERLASPPPSGPSEGEPDT